MSTTGYGDITPLNESDALKLGVMGLMLVGALSLALVYALITDAIVGVRLARSLGERPRPRRDHVVVLGLGRIGQRVIEDLVALRIQCIAVERNEHAPGVQQAHRLRVPVVLSDAATPSALDELFLEHARCVMVLTDDDACESRGGAQHARRHSDLRVVLRLFDHDLARARRGGVLDPRLAQRLEPRRARRSRPRSATAARWRRSRSAAQAVTVAELAVPIGRTVAELEQAARARRG